MIVSMKKAKIVALKEEKESFLNYKSWISYVNPHRNRNCFN